MIGRLLLQHWATSTQPLHSLIQFACCRTSLEDFSFSCLALGSLNWWSASFRCPSTFRIHTYNSVDSEPTCHIPREGEGSKQSSISRAATSYTRLLTIHERRYACLRYFHDSTKTTKFNARSDTSCWMTNPSIQHYPMSGATLPILVGLSRSMVVPSRSEQICTASSTTL